jgi:hypothetical protein
LSSLSSNVLTSGFPQHRHRMASRFSTARYASLRCLTMAFLVLSFVVARGSNSHF